jgi:hypothetical protein
VDPLELLLDLDHVLEHVEHPPEDRDAGGGLGTLWEVSELQVTGARDLTPVGLELAREASEERRLPCAVGTHETDAVARLESARDSLEDGRVAEMNVEVVSREESHGCVQF